MRLQTSAQFKVNDTGSVVKQLSLDPPQVDDEARTIKFTVSSGNPDRDNDVVVQAGINFEDYMRNPVVLWGHEHDNPIGKCIELGLENGNLTATFELIKSDVPCFGDRAEGIYQMCKGGFLFATSISFLPTDWARSKDRDGGYDFNECSILEISICSVPANPDAIIIPAAKEPAEQPKSADVINTLSSDASQRRKRLMDVISRKI